MGYYTRYNLSIIGGHYDIIEAIVQCDEEKFYAIDEFGECVDAVKWYDHTADMLEVSKEYPDLIFKLEGEGEESGDIWIKYFKNGKMQVCEAEITFEDYDESKLR